MNNYPGLPLPPPEPVDDNLDLSPYVVDGMLTSFHNISLFGQANHVNLIDTFKDAKETTYKILVGNHFQGVARHRDGRYFYVSGDNEGIGSHLFIMKLGSYLENLDPAKHAKGPLRSNLITKRNQATLDTIIDLFILDKPLYHAGGVSMMGDVLVVALEGDNDARIDFLDVRKPESPVVLDVNIPIPGSKAGSASAIQLPNGHILCAAWTESTGRHFKLFLSKQPGLTKFSDPLRVEKIENNLVKSGMRFQAMHFVQDDNGELYLIGLDSEKKTGGNNRWHLLHFALPHELLADNPKLVAPKITRIISTNPHKGYSYYNFNSCGGVYVDPKQNLAIYGGGHSRGGLKGNTFKLSEFYPKLNNNDVPSGSLENARIELYTEPMFGGRMLVIDLSRENEIPNFHKVKVPGPTIDDHIRSIVFMIPDGETYNLYEDTNYNLDDDNQIKAGKQVLSLKGTGKLEFIDDTSTHPDAQDIKISSGRMS